MQELQDRRQIKDKTLISSSFFCAVVVLSVFFMVFSCSRKSDGKQNTVTQTPTEKTSAVAAAKELTAAEPEQELKTPQGTGDGKDSRPEQIPTAIRSNREQDIFSARGVQTPLMPVDSILGPLGQSTDYDGDQRNAMDRAKEFLDAMQKGLSYSDKFMEGRRDLLALLLELNRDRGLWPKSSRLGVPETVSSLQIAIPILCEGKKGWALGRIVMEKALEKWLVADVQLEWENLGEEGRPRPVFDPAKGMYQR